MKRKTLAPLICTALFCAFPFALSHPAYAQSVPQLINYQGRLSDSNGGPLATRDYQLTFNIYDTNNGGALIWGPQIFDGANGVPGHGLKVPVVQGYFNVMLGPTDISNRFVGDSFNATNRFVEITVEANAPIRPRQQVLTAPFAFNSARLAGADWSAVFGTNDPVNGQIGGSKIQNGSITSAQIALATITGAQIATNTITFTNLFRRQSGPSVGPGGLAISADSGMEQDFAYLGQNGPIQLVTNLSVTITTTGRPVYVGLVPTTNNLSSYVGGQSGSPNGGLVQIYGSFVRDGTNYLSAPLSSLSAPSQYYNIEIPPSAFNMIDFPPAGTHSYAFGVFPSNGTTGFVKGCMLVAYEL
jgi:hypothetical protein